MDDAVQTPNDGRGPWLTCQWCETPIYNRGVTYYDSYDSARCTQIPGGAIEPFIYARHGRIVCGMHAPPPPPPAT